jgi:hypothetical protein
MKPDVTKPIRSNETIYPHSMHKEDLEYFIHFHFFTVLFNLLLYSFAQLFRHIESYARKPPRKSIVPKVADAYEVLGLFEENEKY